jgi:hypothetical protein
MGLLKWNLEASSSFDITTSKPTLNLAQIPWNFLVTNPMVTKPFQSPFIWQSKTFDRQSYDDQKVTNLTMTKSFSSPIMWWSKKFGVTNKRQLKAFSLDFDHPINDGLISIGLIWLFNFFFKNRNLNSFFPLKCVGLVLFNKQPLPYNLRRTNEIFMGI